MFCVRQDTSCNACIQLSTLRSWAPYFVLYYKFQRLGRRTPPPSEFFFLFRVPFCYAFLLMWGLFLHVRGLFATFFPCWGLLATFSPCGGLLLLFFSMWGPFLFLWGGGGLFWACPLPLQNFLREPMIAMNNNFKHCHVYTTRFFQ